MKFIYKPGILSLGAIVGISFATIGVMGLTVALIYYYGQKRGFPFLKQPIPDAFQVNYNPSISECGSDRPPNVRQSSSNCMFEIDFISPKTTKFNKGGYYKVY